jgi:signal transduction histidine kinase
LNRLIDTFVDLAHIEQGSFEISMGRVELVSVVHSAVEQAFAQSGVGSRVETGLPAQPIWIHGDQRRLEQVFAHLLSNAIRYSPAGSQIRVTLAARQPEGRAVVEVADRGPGLPPWMHQRLFEPFQEQPSPGTGGLGVGLFLSRTIVEAHGGHISAASPDDGGTIVTVVLPM